MGLNIIAAAEQGWGIGKEGRLLAHIPEDMAFFREKTEGKTVIMGRKTFLSLPKQQPLPNRRNIVITTDLFFQREGISVCHSLEEAIQTAKAAAAEEDIFFIGGERVYREAEPYCHAAYITKILKRYEADVFLPSFDALPQWQLIEEKPLLTKSGIPICFCTYQKK